MEAPEEVQLAITTTRFGRLRLNLLLPRHLMANVVGAGFCGPTASKDRAPVNGRCVRDRAWAIAIYLSRFDCVLTQVDMKTIATRYDTIYANLVGRRVMRQKFSHA